MKILIYDHISQRPSSYFEVSETSMADILKLSSLYVCMAIKYIIVLFVETPRKFITAKLSIRKPGSSHYAE
jgi:hypothetical protein